MEVILEKMPNRKLTNEQFVSRSVIIHNNKYDYSLVCYIGGSVRINIICPEHGVFLQLPKDHLRGSGCPLCGVIDMAKKKISIASNSFIEKSNNIHDFIYDYITVNYINNQTKVKIICDTHGSFTQTPASHLSGSGCPKCFRERLVKTLITTQEEFIFKANISHNNRYDYSKMIYKDSYSKIEVICFEHGSFLIDPRNHISGHGCQRCARENRIKLISLTKESFIEKANFIHNFKYDYANSVYKGYSEYIDIICTQHGAFLQIAGNHLYGSGCIRCSTGTSKKEVQWLDLLGIPNDDEHRLLTLKIANKFIRVDGYDPDSETIYEFYGDYWHGNPAVYKPDDINKNNKKLFGLLYNKTLEKELFIISNGYKLVSIWENDFNKLGIK